MNSAVTLVLDVLVCYPSSALEMPTAKLRQIGSMYGEQDGPYARPGRLRASGRTLGGGAIRHVPLLDPPGMGHAEQEPAVRLPSEAGTCLREPEREKRCSW